jgi:hypothetical protein
MHMQLNTLHRRIHGSSDAFQPDAAATLIGYAQSHPYASSICIRSTKSLSTLLSELSPDLTAFFRLRRHRSRSDRPGICTPHAIMRT